MKIIIFILKTLNFILIAWMITSLVDTAFNIKSVHKPKETHNARAFLFTIAFITPIILIDRARDKRIHKECLEYEKTMMDAISKEITKQKIIAADPDAYYTSQEWKDKVDEYIREENRQDMREHFPDLADKFIKKD